MRRALATLITLVGCLSCRSHRPVEPTPVFPLEKTWDVPAGDIPSGSTAIRALIGDGDSVLLSLQNDVLHALDCIDGTAIWSRSHMPGTVSIGEGLLVVARRNGMVRGLDPRTGDGRWRTQTGVSDPLVPWIDSDRVVVAGMGLTSLDVKTGVVQWKRGEGRFTAPPSVVGTRIIVGDSEGTIHAFDARTGRILWIHRTNSALLCPAIGDQDGRLYLGTTDGWFLALHARNGGLDWRWRVGADTIYPAIIYEDRVCFSGNDAVVYALKRRNGHMLWRAPLTSRPLGAPILSHKSLLIPCFGEREGRSVIIGVDVRNGLQLGVFETPAELAVSPVPCGERFILGLRDRSIMTVAHQSPTPTPTPSSLDRQPTPLTQASPTVSPAAIQIPRD